MAEFCKNSWSRWDQKHDLIKIIWLILRKAIASSGLTPSMPSRAKKTHMCDEQNKQYEVAVTATMTAMGVSINILYVRLLSNTFCVPFSFTHSLTKTQSERKKSVDFPEWTVLRNKNPWAQLVLSEFQITSITSSRCVLAKTSRHVGAQHETELVNRLPFAIASTQQPVGSVRER